MTTTRSSNLASRPLPSLPSEQPELASVNYENLAFFPYPNTSRYANVVDDIKPEFSKKTDLRIASRSLSSRPAETLVQALDPIYAELNFPEANKVTSLELSENTHKLSNLFDKLHSFLSKLEEMLVKILASKEKGAFAPEKCYVKVTVATPLSEAEKILARDEFFFENTSQYDFELLKKRLEMLKGSLEAMQFVLTGIVSNANKVFYGEYGEQLGVGITKPLSEAQTKLLAVEKRLQEVIAFQSEQFSSTTAHVSPENRYHFFSNKSNENGATSFSERDYENQDVIKGIPKVFIG
jgi:hypothetical protein